MRSHAWARMRAACLAENERTNHGLCTLRLKGCTGKATQVHHTLGINVTGHDPRYIAAVCRECNLKEGDPMAKPDPPHKPITVW